MGEFQFSLLLLVLASVAGAEETPLTLARLLCSNDAFVLLLWSSPGLPWDPVCTLISWLKMRTLSFEGSKREIWDHRQRKNSWTAVTSQQLQKKPEATAVTQAICREETTASLEFYSQPNHSLRTDASCWRAYGQQTLTKENSKIHALEKSKMIPYGSSEMQKGCWTLKLVDMLVDLKVIAQRMFMFNLYTFF